MYVDGQECRRTSDPMAWSYATCGEIDLFERDILIRNVAHGAPLRVSFPSDFTWRVYTAPDNGSGIMGSGHEGAYPEFVLHLLHSHGFTFTFVPISQRSRSQYLSSYTACVLDVALNNTDLCVGGHWATDERLAMTTFTSQIDMDSFSLLGQRSGSDSAGTLSMGESLREVCALYTSGMCARAVSFVGMPKRAPCGGDPGAESN